MDCNAQQRLRNRTGLLHMGSRMAVLALFALAFFAAPARANTSVFASPECTLIAKCYELSAFGILTGVHDTFTTTGGMTVNGGIGIQAGGVMQLNGGNTTTTDIVDFSDSLATRSTTCGTTTLCGSGTLNGVGVATTTTPQQNASAISTANTALTNIETQLAAIKNSATAIVAAPTSGTKNIETNATSLGGNVYAYRTTGSANYATSNTLTFNCGGGATGVTKCADDILVVVLSTSGTVTFQDNIILGDGLTSDQVIFYIPTANTTFTNVGGNNTTVTFNGDFFFNNAQSLQAVSLGGAAGRNLALNGRLYGGNFSDGNSALFTQNDNGTLRAPRTPEPGTWILLLTGFGCMIWWRRRTRRAA